MTFPAWPPGQPWPESQRETNGTGAGTDFPSSAGAREAGKFRPSRWPQLDTLAVVDDDGRPIGTVTIPFLHDQEVFFRAIIQGLNLLTGHNLLDDVAGEDV